MAAKLVNCECGETVRGDSDEQLIANVTAHVDRHHPEQVGKLSRADILAMTEEADTDGT